MFIFPSLTCTGNEGKIKNTSLNTLTVTTCHITSKLMLGLIPHDQLCNMHIIGATMIQFHSMYIFPCVLLLSLGISCEWKNVSQQNHLISQKGIRHKQITNSISMTFQDLIKKIKYFSSTLTKFKDFSRYM